MKNKREDLDYLNDIFQSINDIEEFSRGMSLTEFANDKRTAFAVIRAFEVIGEASKRISESIKMKYPFIEWEKISGFRDKLIRDYSGIDIEVVFQTIIDDIPAFKPQIKSVIENETLK